jgi:hypothetical protein
MAGYTFLVAALFPLKRAMEQVPELEALELLGSFHLAYSGYDCQLTHLVLVSSMMV